jgi:lauroyl/myristoyl acyltransferase
VVAVSSAPIQERGVLLACRFIRALEQVLPVRVIWILCWPIAAVLAGWQLIFASPTIRQFDRLPAALRPRLSRRRWAAYLWRERTRVFLARLLVLWPDRLRNGRWVDHCRSVGLERLKEEHARGRPVALALLHFGPMILVCHWLRAWGLPAAVLQRQSSANRPLFKRFIDQLTSPAVRPEIPSVFDPTELRRAREHLRKGRILAMTVEGRHVRHHRLSGEGCMLDMATSVLRLAAATGAVVMPCLIVAGPRMSFTLHLGEPVPEELVVDEDRHRAASDHLLREFLAVVGRHPGQAHAVLIHYLHPATGEVATAAEELPEPAS